MSALPSVDPACDVLLSAARNAPAHTGLQSQALLGLFETCQTLSTWMRRELARNNLTENGFRLLAQVLQHESDGATSNVVTHGLGLPRPVISATLGRLEVSGLITRERSADDRRTFALKITPEGRRVFQTALHHCLREVNRAMSQLTPRHLEQLDQTCAQLRLFFADHHPART